MFCATNSWSLCHPDVHHTNIYPSTGHTKCIMGARGKQAVEIPENWPFRNGKQKLLPRRASASNAMAMSMPGGTEWFDSTPSTLGPRRCRQPARRTAPSTEYESPLLVQGDANGPPPSPSPTHTVPLPISNPVGRCQTCRSRRSLSRRGRSRSVQLWARPLEQRDDHHAATSPRVVTSRKWGRSPSPRASSPTRMALSSRDRTREDQWIEAYLKAHLEDRWTILAIPT